MENHPTQLKSIYTTKVSGDEQLRPAAIIPWSQYQRRLGKLKEGSLGFQKENDPFKTTDTSSASNSFFGSYEKDDLSLKQLPRFDENEPSSGSKTRSQYGNVIRPQIRGRLPADPSDFMKIPRTNQVEFLMQRELNRESLVPPERPHASSKTSSLPSRIPLRMEQTPTHKEMNKIPSLAIPNGVPMTAGSWETGQPHYTGERKLHAANTFAGSPSFLNPLNANNLIGNELPTAPIYQKVADSNIVSSIFSQSQARPGAIPTMVQTSQPQAYLEKFLTNEASLDQFSNLAKNLLGVGTGRTGETSSGSGGLLETMTSVLSGGNRNLPTSSAAHDDLSQYTPSSAGRPQTSVFQKLLNQATDALKDSWNKKTESKDNLDAIVKKTDLFALSTPEPLKKEKISKDKENSIKLLENMPAEQRKMLEAAIMSGEIDADSPAIKTLVKNDVTEESKKEKENRLIEWIRANRPSKTPENTIPKNVPYYGKYLGSLAETPIDAKPRPNVAAVKLFEGIPPIVANVTRVKRDEGVINATAKPIELFVEGGIMKIRPGNGNVKLETQTETVTSIPDGFRLKQPEFDAVDDQAPQPLQWFEGFQPLMLTLPPSKVFSDIHWVSLRDHKRKANVASVILPNGPLVQIPKVIRLRTLSPNSLAFNISSGPIEVLDVKTIRINNFSFQHDDDSVWLMVGSELFPNMGGKIVPLFDGKEFDCQALRSYHNETITFRLPGELTWKDVFWFSFYSMKRLVSYSEIYLPMSEMHLLPDFSSIAVS
uniref:DM13 domain-containing protein n=1 Tax=Caenorhabditis tropicalis TaxID=1561998 RepID=A0A1I7U0Z9_9PELO